MLGTPLISTMCMNLCELVDDDNAMYYSYFFYLDGTSENPYLSNGGADNADDTDSAIKNALNDAKEWLKETWQKVNGSNAMKWLKILGGVALGILALTALIAGVYKIFETVGDHQAEEKDKRKHGEKEKTTSRKKKPSTKAKK